MNRLLPLALLALASTAISQAPSGFRTWIDKETGLKGYLPKSYKAIPMPPTESVIRMKMVRRTTPPSIKRSIRRDWSPSLYVFIFESTLGGTTPAAPDESVPPDSTPSSIRELMEKRSNVRSFAEFKKKKLRGWRKVDPVDGKEDEFKLSNDDFSRRPARRRDASPEGWLVMQRQGAVRYGVWIQTMAVHGKEALKMARRVARSLELPQGAKAASVAAQVERKLDRIYAYKKLRHVEHRKKVRKNLAPGWKAVDSKNYIIVHHVKNDALIRRIAKDIEAMRAYYMTLFPPARDIGAVSIVRVCRNREEYHRYGGRPGTGGFWHAGNEELVFYDYLQTTLDASRSNKQVRRTTTKDSLLVLYHEAFHQYVYYAVGEVAPHDWFNEGNGDYFSGAVVSTGGKVTRVRPSSWRIHRAKDQMEYGKGRIPLTVLLNADRRKYYGPRVADFYAAGWSFVYFMRTSPEVKKHTRWSKMLGTYFDTLKSSYAAALLLRGDNPTLADKQLAQAAAKKDALRTMLAGVDLDQLDDAWKKYIKKLRDPWPDRRKKRK